jgi:hypothetical protein
MPGSQKLESLDYWRLNDDFSVVDAAFLIIGEDPSEWRENVDWPKNYDPAKKALMNAVLKKKLPADVVYVKDSESMPTGEIDWHQTTISDEELKNWLQGRRIRSDFFFLQPETGPDYLRLDHPSYAPKLAAAVEAWKAVAGDAELRRGKSVKQSLIVWLRQNANRFGLTKEDGNPNEQGIEEVAKIANWDTKGGAPKTPANE